MRNNYVNKKGAILVLILVFSFVNILMSDSFTIKRENIVDEKDITHFESSCEEYTDSLEQIYSWDNKNECKSLEVQVDGNYSYILEESGRIFIFNLTNPSQPNLVTEYYNNNTYETMIVENDVLYINTEFTVDIFNISNKMNFEKITSLTVDRGQGFVGSYEKNRMLKDGNRLFLRIDWESDLLMSGTWLFGIDIANLSNISSVLIFDTYQEGSWEDIDIFYVKNNRLYRLDCSKSPNIIVYNVENLNDFYISTNFTLHLADWFSDLEIKYGFAFIATNDIGFIILNINDDNIQFVNYYNTSGPDFIEPFYTAGYAIAIDGQQLYLADYEYGLMAFDITNLMNPKLLAIKNNVFDITDMESAGNLIFITKEDTDFLIYKLASKDIIWPPEPLPTPTIGTVAIELSINIIIYFINVIFTMIVIYQKKKGKINIKSWI